MKITLKNAQIYQNGGFAAGDFTLEAQETDFTGSRVSDFHNIYVFPAFCDVHVHFR